jgi:hypothetical protein
MSIALPHPDDADQSHARSFIIDVGERPEQEHRTLLILGLALLAAFAWIRSGGALPRPSLNVLPPTVHAQSSATADMYRLVYGGAR